MTPRQKLQIEQSEKRQRLNELLALDELTDEQRGELDSLTKRAQQIEVELRAAIVAEGEGEAEARGMFGPGDGEAGETRRLLESVTLADYLNPAAKGGGIEGRAAEVNAAFKVPTAGKSGGVAVPWSPAGLHDHGGERAGRIAAAYPFNASSAWRDDALGVDGLRSCGPCRNGPDKRRRGAAQAKEGTRTGGGGRRRSLSQPQAQRLRASTVHA